MKQEWKDKWVAALRSGEYEQGKNRLRSADNKFCCLGVLCDLVIKEHDGSFCFVTNGDYYDDDFLPAHVIVALSMKDYRGTHRNNDGELVSLTSLNDNGMSFLEIADVIDEYWEQL